MSRVIRFDHFLPVEKSKFLSALESAGLDATKFEVSKMEIAPPLMPGSITALVTVKLASSALAFSYEDAAAGSWVEAFQQDLLTSRFDPSAKPAGQDVGEPPQDLSADAGAPYADILTTRSF